MRSIHRLDRVVIGVARGIGEPLAHNLPMQIANLAHTKLLGKRGPQVIIKELRWPAEYGPVPKPLGQNSFNESLAQLKFQLTGLVQPDPNTMYVLVGFSAGAAGIGDWLAEQPQSVKKLIISVHLVSDPSMPKGIAPMNMVLREEEYGVRGSRRTDFLDTHWYWRSDDVICCCPDNSPIRKIAKATPDFVLADATTWLPTLQKLTTMKAAELMGANLRYMADRQRREQALDQIRRRYDEAFKDAMGYLATGAHTSYGTRKINGMTSVQKASTDIAQLIQFAYGDSIGR
ncbi:lysin B [Gordonia phage DumpTruck]|nr:lysin B [Gordonia phage DumpTruck]